MIIEIIITIIVLWVIVNIILTIITFSRLKKIETPISQQSSAKFNDDVIKIDNEGNVIINNFIKIGKNDNNQYLEIYKKDGNTNIKTNSGVFFDVGNNDIMINTNRIRGTPI